MWLRFNCVGPRGHHLLNWTNQEGEKMLGFTFSYKVSEELTSGKSWSLSSIFALTVLVIVALALAVIGVVIYRWELLLIWMTNYQQFSHESCIFILIQNVYPQFFDSFQAVIFLHKWFVCNIDIGKVVQNWNSKIKIILNCICLQLSKVWVFFFMIATSSLRHFESLNLMAVSET